MLAGTRFGICQNTGIADHTMPTSKSFLFYEDEDKILPLLLHQSDERGAPCLCADCQGLRLRIRQIASLQTAAESGAA